ncbi:MULTISPECIES: peptidoglycan recognition protein family protein [Burkholderia]|uniref:peptidoglycan recognition protein family protein n=1 Tax=unclassified Burkholderia TaxID=2613784 RepID=UPI000B7A7115|nr:MULTISPECIES: peptidoglycan recognition family protein [unclassified Burkholderia]MBR8238778.1 N-acetylmuramoyl-L-alanine amidase [Burkholderia sp. AU32357]MBY4876998.1 N-acetylmuramoyl-L-alanine amidase [Burkholderia sp. AU42008]OXI43010.1 N-acetylmuramoyl-L-alanine amidase [Burkholderia sp. AU17457]
MLSIDSSGMVVTPRVVRARKIQIERGAMQRISGIVVHQTGGSTAASALSSYQNASATGAHFLIEKDGTIYQTASLKKQTWHVGRIKARCVAEMRCTPLELEQLRRFDPRGEDRREMRKAVPDRYPSNTDSIGVELVGEALPFNEPNPDRRSYVAAPEAQNDSLQWLIHALSVTLGVPMTEVFRHPVVSRKNRTEAARVQW